MRSPEDFPADIIAAAEGAFDKLLCNDTESCGGAAGLRRAAIEDIARALMERDRAATEIERRRCKQILVDHFAPNQGEDMHPLAIDALREMNR
jgi:hypothetical protein